MKNIIHFDNKTIQSFVNLRKLLAIARSSEKRKKILIPKNCLNIGNLLTCGNIDAYNTLMILKDYKQKNPGKKIHSFYLKNSSSEWVKYLQLDFLESLEPFEKIEEYKNKIEAFIQFFCESSQFRNNYVLLPLKLQNIMLNIKNPRICFNYLHKLNLENRKKEFDFALNNIGKKYLDEYMLENSLNEKIIRDHFTVGILWRYREKNQYHYFINQPPREIIIKKYLNLIKTIKRKYKQKKLLVLICGYYPEELVKALKNIKNIIYLKCQNWLFEIEIMKRVDIFFAAASGFSEVLWIKRRKPTILFNAPPPPEYVANMKYYNIPYFNLNKKY